MSTMFPPLADIDTIPTIIQIPKQIQKQELLKQDIPLPKGHIFTLEVERLQELSAWIDLQMQQPYLFYENSVRGL